MGDYNQKADEMCAALEVPPGPPPLAAHILSIRGTAQVFGCACGLEAGGGRTRLEAACGLVFFLTF